MHDILKIENLNVCYPELSTQKVLKDINLRIASCERVSLCGFSGSGKTQLLLSVTRLNEKAHISGNVFLSSRTNAQWGTQDLLTLGPAQLRHVRPSQILYILQDAGSFFNSVHTMGRQMLWMSRHVNDGDKQKILLALERYGFADPLRIYRSYPHELSGGMRQRCQLALAYLHKPQLMLIDEPTASLDERSADQAMRHITQLCQDTGSAALLVTHDLDRAKAFCQRMYLMEKGQLIEELDRNSGFLPKAESGRRLFEQYYLKGAVREF